MRWNRYFGISAFAFFSLLALVRCSKSSSPAPGDYSYSNYDPIKDRHAVDLENQQLVSTALAKLKDHEIVEVDENVQSQCVYTESNYSLSRINNMMNLNIHIALLNTDSNESDFASDVAEVKACVPIMENFWSRYNIKLNLDFKLPNDKVVSDTIFHQVKLYHGKARSDSLDWFVGSSDCFVYLHEIGHLIGLPDEYSEDGTCRTPKYEAHDWQSYSLMKDRFKITPAESRFIEWISLFPRHIKSILAPVYDDASGIPAKKITLTPKKLLTSNAMGDVIFVSSNDRKINEQPYCMLHRPEQVFKPGQKVELKSIKRLRYFNGKLDDKMFWSTPTGHNPYMSLECKIPENSWLKTKYFLEPNLTLEPAN
jgi:hypothetical protein